MTAAIATPSGQIGFLLGENLAFDTVEDARDALVELDVDAAVAAGRPLENDLMNVLRGDGLPRMPPDTPLFTEDVQLVKT